METDVDAAYGIVEGFLETIDAAEMCNDRLAEAHDHYVHLFMSGLEEDGFDRAGAGRMIDHLSRIVEPAGWFVAKRILVNDPGPQHADCPQLLCFIDVFPMRGPVQPMPSEAYHAAPRSMRASIMANGLTPGTGGNDHITTPDERLYVCLTNDATEIVLQDMARLRGWTDMDVWTIDLRKLGNRTWRMDVEMPEASAWTDEGISPDAITLDGHDGVKYRPRAIMPNHQGDGF